jgi:hypothetical protein
VRVLSKSNLRLGVLLVLFALAIRYASTQGKRENEKARRIVENGVKSVPAMQRTLLRPSSRGAVLNVKAIIKPVCFTGDWDIIDTEFRSQPHAELLLTAEPLESRSTAEAIVRPVLLSELAGEKPVNMVFPNLELPTSYGLYLCRTSGGSKKCSDKPAASIAELSSRYRVPALMKKKVPADEVTDKIYFFAYIVVDGTSIYYASSKMKDQDLKKLRSLLVASGKEAEDTEKVFSRVHQIDSLIDSLPPKFSGQDFAFFLPRYDGPSCTVKKHGTLPDGMIIMPKKKS